VECSACLDSQRHQLLPVLWSGKYLLQYVADLSTASYVARYLFSLADIDMFVAKHAKCVARYPAICCYIHTVAVLIVIVAILAS